VTRRILEKKLAQEKKLTAALDWGGSGSNYQ
jgi:hypothetical protein